MPERSIRGPLQRATLLGAASWCAFSAFVHIYWVAGGAEGLPRSMRLADHPRLMAAAILAIPLSVGFAWLAASRTRTWWRAALLTGAACFALAHSLPPLGSLALTAVAEQSLPALTERERIALYLYEPIWLLGGILLASAAIVAWREWAA